MRVNKIIGNMGGTIESLLIDNLSIIQGFLNAIDILKEDYKLYDEINENKIISLMIREAMKKSNGTLNPNILEAKAKGYLYDLSLKTNTEIKD